jgi:serine/threonine protein kinase
VKIFSIEATWGWNSMWVSNSFTGDDNWLRERAMHAQLSAIGSANGIVQYRGASSETKGKWNQRLYMEYCAHGDLADLLCTHGKSDGFSPQLDDNYEQIPKVPIPVRALWTFFKDLATAACVMKSGYNPLDEDVSAPLYWEEIIHRDLKPGNVFLTAPLANTGRGIPLCKVGDFGLAVPRHYEPLPNPERMCSAGSLGWKAPEYNAYAEDLGIDYELSSATDIWAIGRIMLALMELTATRPPTIRYDDDGGGQVIVEAKDELVSMYGEELYNLVEKCLDPLPDDRITARQLLRKIDRQLSNPLVTLPLELREGDVLDYKQDMRWAT